MTEDIAQLAGKGMPGATPEQENDPVFKAIWEGIKNWDIGISEYYSGYCLATGSHVALIMDALKAADIDVRMPKSDIYVEHRMLDDF